MVNGLKDRISKYKDSVKNKLLIAGGLVVMSTPVLANEKENSSKDEKSNIKDKIEFLKDSINSYKELPADTLVFEDDDFVFEKSNIDSVQMKIGEENVARLRAVEDIHLGLLVDSEGFRNKSYLCSSKVRTIGYGYTIGITSRTPPLSVQAKKRGFEDIQDGAMVIAREQANSYAEEFIYPVIRDYIKVPLKEHELIAVASLIYNIGPRNFTGGMVKTNKGIVERDPSPVLVAINEGKQGEDVAKYFSNHIRDRIVYANPALMKRRAFEATGYVNPDFFKSMVANGKLGFSYRIDLKDAYDEDVFRTAKKGKGSKAKVVVVADSNKAKKIIAEKGHLEMNLNEDFAKYLIEKSFTDEEDKTVLRFVDKLTQDSIRNAVNDSLIKEKVSTNISSIELKRLLKIEEVEAPKILKNDVFKNHFNNTR